MSKTLDNTSRNPRESVDIRIDPEMPECLAARFREELQRSAVELFTYSPGQTLRATRAQVQDAVNRVTGVLIRTGRTKNEVVVYPARAFVGGSPINQGPEITWTSQQEWEAMKESPSPQSSYGQARAIVERIKRALGIEKISAELLNEGRIIYRYRKREISVFDDKHQLLPYDEVLEWARTVKRDDDNLWKSRARSGSPVSSYAPLRRRTG